MAGDILKSGVDTVSDALKEARNRLAAIVGEDNGKEVLKNLGYEDLDQDKINNLQEDEAIELAAKAKEAMDNRHETIVEQAVDRLMGMSFAAYFNVLQDFINTHPNCTPLEGFSRAQIEKFVRENMINPGDNSVFQFEERLTNSQQAIDGGTAQPVSAPVPAPRPVKKPDDTAPNPGDANPTGPEAAEVKEAKEKAAKEILDALLAPMEGESLPRLRIDEGVFQGEDALEPDEAKAILDKLFENIEQADIESTKASLLADLLQRQKDIDAVTNEMMRSNYEELLKKAAEEASVDDYKEADTVDLDKFAAKFKEIIEAEAKEDKKKKRKRGRAVVSGMAHLKTVVVTALAAVMTLSAVTIMAGTHKNRAAVPAETSVSDSDGSGESDDELDRHNPEGGESDQQQDQTEGGGEEADDNGETPADDDEKPTDDVENGEAVDETWDALHGGDARGLWANADGTGPNEAKAGERNLVAPTEFEKFLNADFEDEAVQKEFKEHFMGVATKEAAVLEQIADYAQKHGYLELLPESIRGLQGEDLENAINENKDGCYDELLNNLKQRLETATVSTTRLEAGSYSNYYAHMVDPDGLATKDNLELETCTTWENGTQVFRIAFEDGTVMQFKGGCIQLVEKITPPEDETPPPEDETPPPEDETPPPEDETPPPEDETPPPEDNSKSEEGLAEGQDAYVVPVQEGDRITESKNPYVWDSDGVTVEPISQDALNADQTLNEINYYDDEAAAEAQKRQEAAEEQAAIDAAASEQEAEPVDLDALGGSGF